MGVLPVPLEMTDYLEIVLALPSVQGQMIKRGTGTQHIHLRDLRATRVPISPLSEQQEIVRRVDALFALADAIEQRVAADVRGDGFALQFEQPGSTGIGCDCVVLSTRADLSPAEMERATPLALAGPRALVARGRQRPRHKAACNRR